jgi:hypothetical protein
MNRNPHQRSVLSENLQQETLQLQNAWSYHNQFILNSYLVEGVEDPRINIQSILTRHFLLRELFGDTGGHLMEHELRFALTANWLLARLTSSKPAYKIRNEMTDVLLALCDEEESQAAGAPTFLKNSFQKLSFPNYIERLLSYVPSIDSKEIPGYLLDTFMEIWSESLGGRQTEPISVIEPACGSANDYRFIHRSGLSKFLDYTGFDLCVKNIANAAGAFPNIDFAVGNAFELSGSDNSHEFCFVHDLFEHLSLEGLEKAILEIGRITSRKACFHFFNMADIPNHQINRSGHYHWNLLSVRQIHRLLEPLSTSIEVIHLDSFLKEKFDYPDTHNKKAYTWIVELK